ncbi:unnamed protein product [Bursaphelenchus okinawaensis]|uniref:Peptidase A1 domain-containing protein n=1 Tax=Bursaphelenchus okinawaensis TaxID=465554 RepID=A0A811LM28_9BILA|nr:unnamed protein product [Bursaphelenchus okinawaensis]CAG9127885.1 unnamed protein product [Bursaphelenchus okinawaensis]
MSCTECAKIKYLLSKKAFSNQTLLQDVYGHGLTNQKNYEYHGIVSLGTPPQEFRVIFDTGSHMLWVPRVGCKSTGYFVENCKSNDSSRLYDPEMSTTSEVMQKKFEVVYGGGDASGSFVQDYFAFGLSGSPLKLSSKITFGAGEVMHVDDDGVLGLAPEYSNQQGTSVFQTAVREGLFDKPIFTTYLRKCHNDQCDDGGMINLGDIDVDNCEPVEHWVNVKEGSVYWEVEMNAVYLNGQSLSLSPISAVSDTGSPFIYAPKDIYYNIVKQLQATDINGHTMVDCDLTVELVFQIPSQHLVLTSEELVLKVDWSDKCLLAISKAKFDFWVIGDPFNRAYCIVHDVEKRTLGFAKSVHNEGGTMFRVQKI